MTARYRSESIASLSRARRELDCLQVIADPCSDGTQDQLLGHFVQHVNEPASLNLAIADVAKQSREPPEFTVQVADRWPVELMGEYSQCAA
jgi:hypothetical protein